MGQVRVHERRLQVSLPIFKFIFWQSEAGILNQVPEFFSFTQPVLHLKALPHIYMIGLANNRKVPPELQQHHASSERVNH